MSKSEKAGSAVLREAAALMRARATGATPGPWRGANEHANLGPDADPAWCISRMRPGYASMSATAGYLYDVAEIAHDDERSEADCHHIASWHPVVALAVADWLDKTAVIAAWGHHVGPGPVDDTVDAALTVPHAYLGTAATEPTS